MSRICQVTGKKPLTGHKVSHSNRKSKIRQLPNLRKKRVFDESTGRWMTVKVTTAGLRTINKVGVKKAIQK